MELKTGGRNLVRNVVVRERYVSVLVLVTGKYKYFCQLGRLSLLPYKVG